MGVILGEAADAQQPMHGAGTLVTIHIPQLRIAHRQITVALGRVLVDENVERAVHRFHPVIRVVQLHRGEHVLRVEAFMAADLPQIHPRHVRRIHQLVAALQALVPHPVFHDPAHHGAFGMPEDQSRPGNLLDGEKVELLAQDTMIAALRLLQAGKVLLHFFVGEKCGAVNALQLGIVFVPQPVGPGQVHYFVGLDPAGRRHVRPAAKIFKGAVAVEGNILARLGEALDKVGLHEIVARLEARQALVARLPFAHERLVARDHFRHPGFDGFQVFGGKGRWPVEIVKEAGIRGRTMAELGLGIELEHRGRHHVRGGVAHHFQRVRHLSRSEAATTCPR